MKAPALGLLLTLAACHQAPSGEPTGAEAEARARTAAKTLADIDAADRAAASPLPRTIETAPRERDPAPRAEEPDTSPEAAVDANAAE